MCDCKKTHHVLHRSWIVKSQKNRIELVTRPGDVTGLRLDPNYITYYWMWTRLFATGVVPLLVLALLNSKIYFSIRQSKHRLRSLALRSALPMAILETNPAVAAASSPAAAASLTKAKNPLRQGSVR